MGLFSTVRFIWSHPFSRGRRMDAIGKFLSYQIAIRIFPGTYGVDWLDDVGFLVSRGETGLTGNLYCGFTEYQDMTLLSHFLIEGDHFYDIGANVGAYSLLASGFKRAYSYAFEPVPSTFERLSKQVKFNQLDDLITLYNVGVGGGSDVLEFTNSQNCTNRVNTDPLNRDVTLVDVIGLDSLEVPAGVSVAKIDVEGFEKFVFEGGALFFTNPNLQVLIVELNGSGELYGFSDKVLNDIILSFGFFPVSYDPFVRHVCRLEVPSFSGNVIYVRDLDFVQCRVTNSKPVVVHTAGSLSL